MVGYCIVVVVVGDCNMVIVVVTFCNLLVCDCCMSAIVKFKLVSCCSGSGDGGDGGDGGDCRVLTWWLDSGVGCCKCGSCH